MFVLGTINYGDLPTWIGSIAAISALIFLRLNFRVQSEQLSLQEKQIKEQQEKYRSEKRREQANKFAFWVEANVLNPRINFINDSILPVLNVYSFCYEIESDSLVNIYGSDNKSIGFRSIPKGKEYVKSLPEGKFDLTKKVEVYFTDSSGIGWKKSSDGSLVEFKTNSSTILNWMDTPEIKQ